MKLKTNKLKKALKDAESYGMDIVEIVQKSNDKDDIEVVGYASIIPKGFKRVEENREKLCYNHFKKVRSGVEFYIFFREV